MASHPISGSSQDDIKDLDCEGKTKDIAVCHALIVLFTLDSPEPVTNLQGFTSSLQSFQLFL